MFVVVNAICSLSHGDELLIDYSFHIPLTTRQIRLALGQALDAPLGHKKKIWLIVFIIFNEINVNYCSI